MNVENKIAPRISSTVSKLGSQIFSINLPQGITCRPDAPCMKGCYAKKVILIIQLLKLLSQII